MSNNNEDDKKFMYPSVDDYDKKIAELQELQRQNIEQMEMMARDNPEFKERVEKLKAILNMPSEQQKIQLRELQKEEIERLEKMKCNDPEFVEKIKNILDIPPTDKRKIQ